jgi:ubiquitin-protein ligase
MNKERILKEAQDIASSFSFWMVSGNISHLYGYILKSSGVKYELEVKFDQNFPSSPPKLKFYDAIKDLLGQINLSSLDNWTEETKVVEILSELKEKIMALISKVQDSDRTEELLEPFSKDIPSETENNTVKENSLVSSQQKRNSTKKTDDVQPREEEEYITPDLNAYPPEFDVSEYIMPAENDVSQSFSTKSQGEPFLKESKPEDKIKSEDTENLSSEILDTDHSSVLINTEIGLIQQEYAYDQMGTVPGKIMVYLTITLSKTFMIEMDLSQYPKEPLIKFPKEAQNLLGGPKKALNSLKDWNPESTPHVIDVIHELETKLLFIQEIEAESKKIQGEYQCEMIPSDPTRLRIHLVTYGFKEYTVDIDINSFPKRPRLSLSSELNEILNIPLEELEAFKGWTESESECVEILREISWLVDKNSRINFEIELLKEHYKDINYEPQTQILNVEMEGKMKSQDLTFQFQIHLPNEYPTRVPEIKVVNEFELESHEKIKKDLQSSFESFFDDWTPFKYLVDLFNAISKKIFEVSVVSCVICHKIECPTCSKKIAGPDEESCHVECPYCERPYHDHCWAQTIRSFGKCGFCLKTPPIDMMPH